MLYDDDDDDGGVGDVDVDDEDDAAFLLDAAPFPPLAALSDDSLLLVGGVGDVS